MNCIVSVGRLPLLWLAVVLGLSACGYGWEKTSPAYPASTSRLPTQVIAGRAIYPLDTVVGPGHYIVQPGDTLYSIGSRAKLDFKDIARWNDIGSDYLIVPGQFLRLSPDFQGNPTLAAAAPVRAAEAGEVVQRPVIASKSIITPVQIPKNDTVFVAPSAPAPMPAVPRVSIPAAPIPVIKPVQIPAVVAPTVVTSPVVTPPAARLNSEWRWPVPSKSSLLRTFSLANGMKGIDIGGRVGDSVRAANGGRVVFSGNGLKGYGEVIIIKHDEDYLSAYGFNRLRLVKEGDYVQTGQVIAEMGTTPDGVPGVHFEIRLNSKPVDPLKYLPPQ